MFSAIKEEHRKREQQLHEEAVASGTAAREAARKLSDSLVDAFNAGVSEAFDNQKEIESHLRHLKAQAATLQHQADKWATLISSVDKALLEIGDFENILDVVETDCSAIADGLEKLAEKRAGPSSS